MSTVLRMVLKATRSVFGHEAFAEAVQEFVQSRQQRKNAEHAERKAVRKEDAEGDLLKKENRTSRILKRVTKKIERRDETRKK